MSVLGARVSKVCQVCVIFELKIMWNDHNLKIGRFDSLSVRWNNNTRVAASCLKPILLQFSCKRSHEYTA